MAFVSSAQGAGVGIHTTAQKTGAGVNGSRETLKLRESPESTSVATALRPVEALCAAMIPPLTNRNSRNSRLAYVAFVYSRSWALAQRPEHDQYNNIS